MIDIKKISEEETDSEAVNRIGVNTPFEALVIQLLEQIELNTRK